MTTMEQAYDQASDEIRAKWGETTKPCRYGHQECSPYTRGGCWDEAVAKRTAEILARGAMEHARRAQTIADQYGDSEAFRGYES